MTPKTSSGRWLAGITVSVLVLAIVAVVVTLTAGSGDADPLPEGSPEATVQDFIIAVDRGELDQAYAMLHPDVQAGCPPSDFRQFVRGGEDSGFRVALNAVDRIGDQVHVVVDVTTFSGRPPFDFSEYTNTARFVLEGSEDSWTIVEAPWPFSGCPYRPPLPTATPTPTPTPAVTPAAS